MTVISLDGGCTVSDRCGAFAKRTFEQLAPGGYTNDMSLLELPAFVDAYLGSVRTARKRAARSVRLGYCFARVDRQAVEADVFEINTSSAERQGRPMDDAYLTPHKFNDPAYPCALHAVHPYGVFDSDGRLRAYLWLYRLGQLALVSGILGHADHLRDDVMYLLFTGMVADQAAIGPGFVFYNRHDGGTEGLRFFKERVGLTAHSVEWTP